MCRSFLTILYKCSNGHPVKAKALRYSSTNGEQREMLIITQEKKNLVESYVKELGQITESKPICGVIFNSERVQPGPGGVGRVGREKERKRENRAADFP